MHHLAHDKVVTILGYPLSELSIADNIRQVRRPSLFALQLPVIDDRINAARNPIGLRTKGIVLTVGIFRILKIQHNAKVKVKPDQMILILILLDAVSPADLTILFNRGCSS